jgi:hypothetical protein
MAACAMRMRPSSQGPPPRPPHHGNLHRLRHRGAGDGSGILEIDEGHAALLEELRLGDELRRHRDRHFGAPFSIVA